MQQRRKSVDRTELQIYDRQRPTRMIGIRIMRFFDSGRCLIALARLLSSTRRLGIGLRIFNSKVNETLLQQVQVRPKMSLHNQQTFRRSSSFELLSLPLGRRQTLDSLLVDLQLESRLMTRLILGVLQRSNSDGLKVVAAFDIDRETGAARRGFSRGDNSVVEVVKRSQHFRYSVDGRRAMAEQKLNAQVTK